MSHSSQSRVTSERASIYLQQLCKHFGHKVDVSFTPEAGQVAFPFGGICKLTAQNNILTMTATADDAEKLKQTEEIVGSHLARFAFKEEPQINWA